MDPFGIGITGLGAAGAATFGAFGLAFRARRRRLAAQTTSELAIAAATADPKGEIGRGISGASAGQSDRDRIETIARAQAELALRLDALTAAGSAPEEKLQAMAGQLLGLIRDKNATLETAMAGLDQLRARMKALEEMGEPAEARGLFEGLKSRMGELETRAAAGAAALEARLAALASGGGASELAERLARLHEARDAGLEAALARLAPLETRLAGLESGIGAGREATKRLEAALAALNGEQAQARTEIGALRAAAETAPVRAEARVEARVEALRAELSGRIEAFDRALAARDPQGALDRLAERLEGVADRLMLIETAENPLAEVSERLAGLHAQKDVAVETVLGRLGPLEARIAGVEREIAGLDPQAALDRLAVRLEAVQGQVSRLETAETPVGEISERLAQIHAQKEAAVEAVLSRLAPLEAKLAALEGDLARAAADDQRAAVEGLRTRVETLHWSLGETAAGLAALRAEAGAAAGTGAGVAEIADRLARLVTERDAAKEAGLAAALARLAPLEAVLERLAPLEHALERLGPLEHALERLGPLETALQRLGHLEGAVARIGTAETAAVAEAEATAAAMAARLGALEAVLTRLAPLEARLATLEGRDDPAAARAMAGEVATEFARLRADAAVQTALFADRLALLEASLPRRDARQARAPEATAEAPPATTTAETSSKATETPSEVTAEVPSGAVAEAMADGQAGPGTPEDETIWALPRIISLHK